MIGNGKHRQALATCARRQLKRAGASLIILVAGATNAEYVSSDWALSPGLSVMGASKYQAYEGAALNYEMLAATAELELSSPSRPYYGGLFADYRVSATAAVDDQVNLGAFIRYDLPLWDLTGYVFSHRSTGHSGTAMFAGRLRYRVRGNNKIGIEYMSTLKNSDFSDITVAWYGSMTDSLSFNIGVGRGIHNGPDLLARFELSWQIR